MKLLLVKEIYIDEDCIKAGKYYSSGIILRTVEGRLFKHNDDGAIVPLTEIKESPDVIGEISSMTNPTTHKSIDEVIFIYDEYDDTRLFKQALHEAFEYVIGRTHKEIGVTVRGIAAISDIHDKTVAEQRQRLAKVMGKEQL